MLTHAFAQRLLLWRRADLQADLQGIKALPAAPAQDKGF